jgi:hypothetical protein
VAVVVCVALLAVVALVTRTGGHAKTAPPPRVPKLTVPIGPSEVTLPPPSESPAFVPSRLDGVPGRLPNGIRLLLGGQHPTELGGNPRQFATLPLHGNEAVDGIVPVKDGFVVQVGNYDVTTGAPARAAYWVRPDGRASLIARTDVVIPSQAGDRIFAYRTGPGDSAPLAKRIGHLVEVTLAGRVLASHTLPAGLVPLADSPQGLVFSDLARAKVEIRDRRTLAVRKDVAPAEFHVVADRGWLVSSGDPFCTVGCRLTLQNLGSAKKYQVAISDNRYVGEVAVNPNGRSVAISYWGAEAPGSVVVADLASGAARPIPGVVVENRRIADLAWTPDGRTLAIAVSMDQHDVRRIALWPVNGGALRVLPGTQQGSSKPWSLAAF